MLIEYRKALARTGRSVLCVCPAEGKASPGSAGTRESCAITGVPEDTRYFAVRSFDDSHNRSGMSNIAKTE
jgi:hypothetical protein